MRTSFNILKHDLITLVKNPIALLVVLALLVLPGLYAWYCIVANWDPYSNTGGMPIAIVNKDKGATSSLAGEVNIGEQVVENLKDNHNIDWRFYDDEEMALEDTRRAVCYATIVFPEDLSENVVGIFDGSDVKPTVYYYPNEKYSAVATKVTDSATQTLIKGVNQQFSSKVNEAFLQAMQQATSDAEEKVGDTHSSVLSELKDSQRTIEGVIKGLDDTLSSIDGYKSAIAGAQTALEGTASELPAIREGLDQGSVEIKELNSKLGSFEGTFAKALLKTGTSLSTLSAAANSEISTVCSDLEKVGAAIDGAIVSLESVVENYKSILDPEVVEEIEASLEDLRAKRAQVDEAVRQANDMSASMNDKVQQLTSTVASITNSFTTDIMPKLNAGSSDLASSLSGMSSAIGQFEPHIAELQSVLTQTDVALDRSVSAIENAKVLLNRVSENLGSIVTDLGSLGHALKIDRLTEMLDIDPDNMGQFMSSPVEMVTEKIYPVSNYGTAIAPFYTNLALWVGCFILISLIKLEVDRTGFEDATPKQRYFGRLMFVLVLAVLQSQVICGVDILLGIDCANPALFMLAGAICSFLYMNLLFALVITFRNVGKTLCVLLVIMQVPGSSGMYPIEMMPDFFQFIHPALPFTYGIDAMREALCGLSGFKYCKDILVLFIILPVSLLIGLFIRPRALNLIQLFDQEMHRTGFFASEEHGQGADVARVRSLVKALASHESYRDDLEERAWKFRRHYPALRRVGSIALIAIPFVFLAIMLPFNLFIDIPINTKITAFVIVIVVLLFVQMGLVVLEYANRAIMEETRLLGAELLGEDLGRDIGYETIFDEAEDVRASLKEEVLEARLDVYEDAEQVKEEIAEELADAVPPLSDKLVSVLPAVKGKHAIHTRDEKRMELVAAKKRFGVVGEIFRTDLRLGFQSVIGVVVIMLLVITPAMYCWFNTAGSWDPYANTSGLRVAVANDDEGYKGEIMPVTVNIGDTIVSQLRGNQSFDWVFVDKDEAVNGVESGKYYAAIVIPSGFSAKMMTYLVDNTDYPNVYYYTNEKENPIAPLITQKGADSIQESIRQSFTERIDEVGLTLAQDFLDYATDPDLDAYAVTMGGHLDDATRDMSAGGAELHTLSDLTLTASGIVDTAGVALEGVRSAGATAKSAIAEAEEGAKISVGAFEEAAGLMEGLITGDTGIDKVVAAVDTALTALESASESLPTVLNITSGMAERWAERNELVAEFYREKTPPDLEKAAVFDALAKQFDKLSKSLSNAANNASTLPEKIAAIRADIDQLAADTEADVGEAKAFYENELKSDIENLKSTMSRVASSSHTIFSGLEESISGLSYSTGGLSGQLNELSNTLNKAGGKLDSASANISDAKARLVKALNSGDVQQLTQVLLGSDTAAMATSLSAPIQEKREPLYTVRNFGSNMAPFYTVLSLWVGALVMVATMRVHLSAERLEELRRKYVKVRPRHEFLGRYGIFGFVGLLQSLLVLLGDLLFLRIQCVDPVLFILFGLFIGQVFCLIVYTLTELFGDIGKALCVILLIMQVAASGGTFPVEMMSGVFGHIAPYLPFYHAMRILQECVAGVYLPAALVNAAYLLSIVGVMLLIGIVVRRPFRIVTDWLEEHLERTGYM